MGKGACLRVKGKGEKLDTQNFDPSPFSFDQTEGSLLLLLRIGIRFQQFKKIAPTKLFSGRNVL